MLGIFLVIAGVVLAAYLVIKRYYAPWALLMVGILLLICVTLISGDPLVTGKKATHSAVFDIVQVFTNLLQSRAAGIGMNIICVGGFVIGRTVGDRLSGRAEVLGGAILVFIGLEIFIKGVF